MTLVIVSSFASSACRRVRQVAAARDEDAEGVGAFAVLALALVLLRLVKRSRSFSNALRTAAAMSGDEAVAAAAAAEKVSSVSPIIVVFLMLLLLSSPLLLTNVASHASIMAAVEVPLLPLLLLVPSSPLTPHSRATAAVMLRSRLVATDWPPSAANRQWNSAVAVSTRASQKAKYWSTTLGWKVVWQWLCFAAPTPTPRR